MSSYKEHFSLFVGKLRPISFGYYVTNRETESNIHSIPTWERGASADLGLIVLEFRLLSPSDVQSPALQSTPVVYIYVRKVSAWAGIPQEGRKANLLPCPSSQVYPAPYSSSLHKLRLHKLLSIPEEWRNSWKSLPISNLQLQSPKTASEITHRNKVSIMWSQPKGKIV